MKRLFTNISTLAGIVPAGVLRKEGAAMNDVAILSQAWLLVDEGQIAAFGDDTCVRFSYAASDENLAKACDRFEAFVKELS
jgi:aspartate/methionine/tyrosine aminotransferase